MKFARAITNAAVDYMMDRAQAAHADIDREFMTKVAGLWTYEALEDFDDIVAEFAAQTKDAMDRYKAYAGLGGPPAPA